MKLVWLGHGMWEEVTRRVEGEEVGRSQIMWGHFRDPGLHARRWEATEGL